MVIFFQSSSGGTLFKSTVQKFICMIQWFMFYDIGSVYSDLHGQDVGAFATDQKILYSCHVDPPYIGLDNSST